MPMTEQDVLNARFSIGDSAVSHLSGAGRAAYET